MLDVDVQLSILIYSEMSAMLKQMGESELEEDEDDELSWMSDTKKADEPTTKQVTQVLDIYLFIHLFVCSLLFLIYLFIYSFIYSFIYLF